MNRARFKLMHMAPLLILIYGCQPDAPAPSAAPTPAQAAVPAPVTVQAPAVVQPAPQAASAAVSKERELAQKSGCFACHSIEKKLVGPSWNEIAAKYRGQKDAEAKLVAKVAKGGSGVWGSVPMPPNSPKVSDADTRKLVRFILSLK